MTITRLTIDPRRRIQALATSNNNYGIAKQDQYRDVKHSYFLRATTDRIMGHQRLEEDISIKNKLFVIKSLKRKSESNDHEEDLANCLVMLSDESTRLFTNSSDMSLNKDSESRKGAFQCKGCKKYFNSHQALGGHRASHKKVKGCFASNFDETNELTEVTTKNFKAVSEEETNELSPSPLVSQVHSSFDKIKSKVHECSICHRVFSSGQALGGHKRCHWLTSPASPTPSEDSTSSYAQSLTNLLFYSTALPPTFEFKISSMFDSYCKNESISNSNISFEPMLNFNNSDALTTAFSYEKQDLEKEQDEEKDSVDTNCGVMDEYSIKHANCGINGMKKEGVCASWLQIGISSSTTDHGVGAIH